MNLFKNRYFKATRFFLILVGQWPYYESKFKAAKRAVITIVLLTSVMAQIAKFITTDFDYDVVLEIFPFLMFCTIISVKYYTLWINSDMIKNTLNFLKSDWMTLTCKNELNVMEKYTEEGRLYAKFYMLLALSAMCGMISAMCALPILDIVMPLNVSRAMQLPFKFEYFVDFEEYFYPIFVHLQLTVFIGAIAVVASDTLYIGIVFHICGMYGILGYRLEHAFDGLLAHPVEARDEVCCRRIARAIIYHWKTTEYVQLITACYTLSYVLQLFIIVVDIAGILLRLRKSLVFSEGTELVILFVLDVLCHYFLVFLNILPAQRVIDCSGEVFYQAYNSSWCEASPKMQRMLVMIMRKIIKPCVLSAGNVFSVSFEMFASIVQLSVSYFTVIYSTQY